MVVWVLLAAAICLVAGWFAGSRHGYRAEREAARKQIGTAKAEVALAESKLKSSRLVRMELEGQLVALREQFVAFQRMLEGPKPPNARKRDRKKRGKR
ncbi:MAG: hypothetical protein GY871_04660 [Actinomycetales bacterium]|nr:hypothetical protein [Actinomycetales bacterium]